MHKLGKGKRGAAPASLVAAHLASVRTGTLHIWLLYLKGDSDWPRKSPTHMGPVDTEAKSRVAGQCEKLA